MITMQNAGGEQDEVVPDNAPPSIQYLLNAIKRAKLQRLAGSFKEKFANDFFCRQNWPKFDGVMVNINEVKPNRIPRCQPQKAIENSNFCLSGIKGSP